MPNKWLLVKNTLCSLLWLNINNFIGLYTTSTVLFLPLVSQMLVALEMVRISSFIVYYSKSKESLFNQNISAFVSYLPFQQAPHVNNHMLE